MKKDLCTLLASVQLIFILSVSAHASSAFMAAKGDRVLTGRNGDSKNLNVIMDVLPPSDGKYGRIYLGAEDKGGSYYTTGMNDHGLWYGSTSLYDGAALPERNDIKNYYNKPTWPYELTVKVMEECATVDEAIEIYSTYFTPYWTGHTMFVDKFGNSVIVEFAEKDVAFLRKKSNYQVMTNFPSADTLNARWYNCYRYKTAESMLASTDEISTDLFRSVCDAVHQEGSSPTSLSTVYDVTSGHLYVYYFHNYEEVVRFSLYDEVQKGEQHHRVPEFFNQIKLRYPVKGERVNPSSVTFTWNGNAENYNLFYSPDPNFTDVEPVGISTSQLPVENSVAFLPLCFGALILGATGIRKRKTLALVICVAILGLFLSCGIDVVESPFAPSTIEHRQTVENLEPNTLYYWKVVAIGLEGINSESILQTFRTTD